MADDGTHVIYEEVEVSDEDELADLAELQMASVADEDDELNDFDALLAETRAQKVLEQAPSQGATDPVVATRPQVVDDFIRSFFLKNDLRKSLEAFQAEWYARQLDGRPVDSEQLPDAYSQNIGLLEQLQDKTAEQERSRLVVAKAKEQWDKFRKERDFHRLHHRRVVQEKDRLVTDLKRLKRHYEQYEPTLTELRRKYEVAMKEKMLVRLERDRLAAKCESLQQQLDELEGKEERPQTAPLGGTRTRSRTSRDAPWPAAHRANPHAEAEAPVPRNASSLRQQRSVHGHAAAVTSVAVHPKIPAIATASDDRTWKLWSTQKGDLAMTGSGHKDWIADIAMHPKGTLIATASGDATVKLWDVVAGSNTATFAEHGNACWGVDFHDLGDFLLSASMDKSVKVWDLQSQRCRSTLRGHVDAVNSVKCALFSNAVVTASGDKTVSLWDLRTGLCVQTFYGHANAVNHACFNNAGTCIASCDMDGIAKLWDVRNVSEMVQIDTGHHPANGCAFDPSGHILAIASGDATVKTFNLQERAFAQQLDGFADSVQSVAWDANGALYAGGADGTVRTYV